MSEPNSRRLLFIDYSGGNFLLESVKTFDIDDDKDVEVQTVATRRDGAGFKDKPGGGSITLEVLRWSPNLEVDWEQLKQSREKFTLTTQDEDGGVREQFQVCRVANVKGKVDDQGSNMDTVKIVFLRGPVRLPRRAA